MWLPPLTARTSPSTDAKCRLLVPLSCAFRYTPLPSSAQPTIAGLRPISVAMTRVPEPSAAIT